MYRIQLSIVSGFLGAGKTTFIQKLIRDVYANQKVVVLENEFGKIDLDSGTLARGQILVESLVGGCICCSSAGQLALRVEDIIEKHHPDRIVIEPTGLALLSDVMEALRTPYVDNHCEIDHIITVVDAGNFYRRINISKVFFENQISSSRVIFLSKTAKLRDGDLADVIRNIQSVNPFCEIIKEEWDQLPLSKREAALAFSISSDRAGPAAGMVQITGHFQNFSYESALDVSLEDIRNLFAGIQKNEYGEICRAKGVFRTDRHDWFACEYVPGDIRILPLKKEQEESAEKLRICIIGIGLDSRKLRNALGEQLKT